MLLREGGHTFWASANLTVTLPNTDFPHDFKCDFMVRRTHPAAVITFTGSGGAVIGGPTKVYPGERSTVYVVASGGAATTTYEIIKTPRDLSTAETTVMTGDVSLTIDSDVNQFFNCNGANRIVKLPGNEFENMYYIIKNFGAANDIDVQNDAGASQMTLTPADWTIFFYDGSSWKRAGGNGP